MRMLVGVHVGVRMLMGVHVGPLVPPAKYD